MANPLSFLLGGMNQLVDIYKMMNSSDPMSLLTNMAQSNPQAMNVLNAIRSGANPQQLFYDLCKQKGVQPDSILSQLKNK